MDRQQNKEISLIVVMTLYSALLFWALGSISLLTTHPLFIAFLFIAALLWIAFMAVSLALVVHVGMTALMTTLIPFTILVVGLFRPGAIGGALLAELLLLYAHARIGGEVRNHIRFNTIRIFYGGVKILVVTMAIIVAGLAVDDLTEEISGAGISIPTETLVQLTRPLDVILSGSLPSHTDNAAINRLIEQRLNEELGQLPAGSEVSAEQLQLISNSKVQPETSPATASTFSATIASRLNQQLKQITKASPLIAALVLILLIVSIVKLFTPLLSWFILGIIGALVLIAQRSGFAYLYSEQKFVERLKL